MINAAKRLIRSHHLSDCLKNGLWRFPCRSYPGDWNRGIETPEDVLEMMMAGASAVEVGAMNLVVPYIGKKLVLGLPEAMERYGISDLSSVIGVALIFLPFDKKGKYGIKKRKKYCLDVVPLY